MHLGPCDLEIGLDVTQQSEQDRARCVAKARLVYAAPVAVTPLLLVGTVSGDSEAVVAYAKAARPGACAHVGTLTSVPPSRTCYLSCYP
jgi:hypothetical protein